jgi:hypothetical protein
MLTVVGKGGGFVYVSNTGRMSSSYPGGMLVAAISS